MEKGDLMEKLKVRLNLKGMKIEDYEYIKREIEKLHKEINEFK